MSERKADITVNGTGSASNIIPISELDRAGRRARRASVLERGSVGDRLQVPLPDGMYGEWVHFSKEEIYRMEMIGFKIDNEYATKRALHSDGTDKSLIGDVVFMVCDREAKEDIDWHRRVQFEKTHGKPGDKRSTAEEREFANDMATERAIPAIINSTTKSVSGAEIAQTLGVK